MPSKTFRYTGDWQRWNVPKGVEFVSVTLDGAGSNLRKGGRVTGRIRVNGKQTLLMLVGGAGKAPRGDTGGGTATGGGAAGGDGRAGSGGGWGGGGASAIRVNSPNGQVRAVAGGAGGDSGDYGRGGFGGGTVGENGWPGNAGMNTPAVGGGDVTEVSTGNRTGLDTEAVGNATGGTQSQGGNGGTSIFGSVYNGDNATNTVLSRGGQGGGPRTGVTWGGGGGGGGYHPGGGGQAGVVFPDLSGSPGGGGGGGSSFTGGLLGETSIQGDGGEGNGVITISWTEPKPANQPPRPPTDTKIDGHGDTSAYATRSTGTVKVSALLSDPDQNRDKDDKPTGPSDRVRLIVQYSPTQDFSRQVRTERSDLVLQQRPKTKDHKAESGRAGVTLRGLSRNTHYYARLFAQDDNGLWSVQYKSIDFWTNRDPKEPELVAPSDNVQVSELSSVVMSWHHIDPDGGGQRAYQLRYRRARTPTLDASDWHVVETNTGDETYVANPGQFVANAFTEWTVRTKDPQGQWGPWAVPRTFFTTGQAAPPYLLSPTKGEAVNIADPFTFQWKFRDPDQGDSQVKADVRWRVWHNNEAGDWFTLFGTSLEPGSEQEWTLPENTLQPGYEHEWQARTTDSLNAATSQWSESQRFWTTWAPGVEEREPVVTVHSNPMPSLGCGHNRVFVYDRGGRVPRGEITAVANLAYSRQRDDIANCLITSSGFDVDCGRLLSSLRSWIHELVIFRDGVRVWEGPITRITYGAASVEVEAKDVMAYVYRRIMRQGFNDAYRVVNGEQLGQISVVKRGVRIIMNALAPDDPNMLPYLTSLDFPDDARQSRAAPDWSKMAWEEVDDLAATAGLDYVTVGRRVILNDTHRPIGRLQELRSENFSDPPVVSEYGMQLSNVFGVTNNNGIYGYKERRDDKGGFKPYGLVEQLASAYGEDEGASDSVLTADSRQALEDTLTDQASRSISHRFPTPLIVRVPDNSTLKPDTPVSFNQLVPGVWVPLRATGLRPVTQWQKLDLVTVTEGSGAPEQISITLSPAPNGGEDPDSDASAVEAV